MIRLFYCPDPNFGDAMSPLIVEKMSGRQTTFSGIWCADMMAVGSVFYHGGYLAGDWSSGIVGKAKGVVSLAHAWFRRPLIVWGSGFLCRPRIVTPYFKRRLEIHALRGRYSAELLSGMGIQIDTTHLAFGDPGLLFADLFGISPDPSYDIGIVPHVYDRGFGKELLRAVERCGFRAVLIEASRDPLAVSRDIAKCSRIISSSLHGLVVSDSLGIPNLHLGLSTLEMEKEDFELKFRDYYSAFDEEMPAIVEGRAFLNDAKAFLSMACFSRRNRNKLQEIKTALMRSFHDPEN